MKASWFLLDIGETDAFSVFDALPTGCILVNSGKIIAANQSFVDLVGAETKLSVVQQELSIYFGQSDKLTNGSLEVASKFDNQLELKLQTKNGAVTLLAKVSRQVDAQKTKSGFLLSFVEVVNQPNIETSPKAHHKMLFDSVMNLTESYYIYYNLDSEVVEFDQSAYDFHTTLMGVELKKGLPYSQISSPDIINSGTNNYLKEALKKGTVERRCNLIDRKKNKRYFDIFYRLTKDAKGKPLGLIEFCREVTASVKLAIESRNTQFTLQGIIDHSTDMLAVYDTDLNFAFFNDAFKRTVNSHWKSKPEVGANYKEVFSGRKEFQEKYAAHRAVVDEGKEFKTSFRLEIDGQYYYYNNHLSPLKNSENEIVAVVSRSLDVTEEFIRTKELEKTNSTLEAIMESSLSGICALDQDYKVVAYNQTAYGEFLRYGGVDISLSSSVKDQLDTKEFERWDKLFSRVMKGESFSTIVRREEDDRVHRNSYTPVVNNKKQIIAALEMSQDITDYVKSKSELQVSKDRMKTILDRNPAGIARIDLEGRIKYVSPKGAAFFGLTPKEMEGRIASEVVEKDQFARYLGGARRLLNGEDTVYVELEFGGTKGREEKIFTQGVATLIRKDNGDPEEFFMSFLDITEKVKSMSLLEKSQDTYEMLFSNMLNAVIVWNKSTGTIEVVNKAAEKLFGRTSTEIKEATLSSLIPESSNYLPQENIRENFESFRSRMLDGQEIKQETFVVRRADLTERLVDVQVLHLKEERDIVYMTLVDMTEIYDAQKEITRNSSIFESLIHNSFDAIDVIRYDSEEGVYVNPHLVVRNEKMEEMLGDKSKNVVFDSAEQFMLISPDVQLDGSKSFDRIKNAINKTLKTGQNQTEFRLQHSGKTIDVVASQKIVPVDNDIFLIKNFRDISKEVEARNIIQSQIEEAQERNQELEKYIESNLQLENFAYIASHDLKAPIRSVISFAQLLKNNVYKNLDEKNQRFLDIMISASTNMQVLIDDLLAYSRINTQAIEFENIDLTQLLDRLLVEIGSTIADKNGKVIIGTMPASIVADNTRIRQVFQNLITNALKFHKEGEDPKVEVSCKSFPSRYEFAVKDYGIGVEEKYLSEIFLMFKKLHSENKFKGTGIGLSICKKISEQHGGTIRAESQIGVGTTIIFSISKSLEVNI